MARQHRHGVQQLNVSATILVGEALGTLNPVFDTVAHREGDTVEDPLQVRAIDKLGANSLAEGIGEGILVGIGAA